MLENIFRGRVQEGLLFTDGFSFPELIIVTTYIGLVKQQMQENRFRVQEGLYVTAPKLFTSAYEKYSES